MRRRAAVVASVFYWSLAALFLLLTQIGDVNAGGTLAPNEVDAALSMRHRNGLIIFCAELAIYGLLFLALRWSYQRLR